MISVESDYACNARTDDQRYATSMYDGTTLSAPAFEIRWRSYDVRGPGAVPPVATSSNVLGKSSQDAKTTTSSASSISNVANTVSTQSTERVKPTSPGKIAGVVVGSVVACCLCVVGAVLVWQRRRRRLNMAKAPDSVNTITETISFTQNHCSVAELHDKDAGPRELGGDSLHANGVRRPYISLNKSPIELPAD